MVEGSNPSRPTKQGKHLDSRPGAFFFSECHQRMPSVPISVQLA
ncbi:hypothetical protein GLA29479_1933 [Lysobacter antibioticus]|nr:hypothetical protein GLA29479_1933 [Lysobacter antibioticus]